MADSNPEFPLRSYHPSDLPALYRICHATGLNGRDAAPLIADPDLIGHSYVGPYVMLEPEHCFISFRGTQVVGYILATFDSVGFHQHCETSWFPTLRSRYPIPSVSDSSPSAVFMRTIHRGHPPSKRIDLSQFPAHLHIDLLPEAQGKGVGRQLIERLLSELKRKHIPGVHLYASASNLPAIGFYERIGFARIDETETSVGYGYRIR